MLIKTGLLAAILFQAQGAGPEDVTQQLPALPNGHYVERLADGSSACDDAAAHSFDLDVRVTPDNPAGIDGDAGEFVLGLGGATTRYQLTYALSLGRPELDPASQMRLMHMIDAQHIPADGSPPYPLRTNILTSANGDAEIVSAVITHNGDPIILIRSARAPGVHGAAMNGDVLRPFERCEVEAD